MLRHLGAVQAVSLTSKDSIYDYLHPSGGERGRETLIRERERERREMVDGRTRELTKHGKDIARKEGKNRSEL